MQRFTSEDYYKKFLELQEKLRKSEAERLQLEMRFNQMIQSARDEEQNYYRRLRSQYKRFLEQNRRRQERNEELLRIMDRIESRAKMLEAKSIRFDMLRRKYLGQLKINYTGEYNVIPERVHADKDELLLQKIKSDNVKKDALTSYLRRYEDVYQPNEANDIADEIMQSIYNRKQAKEFINDYVKDNEKEKKPRKLLRESSFESSDDDADKIVTQNRYLKDEQNIAKQELKTDKNDKPNDKLSEMLQNNIAQDSMTPLKAVDESQLQPDVLQNNEENETSNQLGFNKLEDVAEYLVTQKNTEEIVENANSSDTNVAETNEVINESEEVLHQNNTETIAPVEQQTSDEQQVYNEEYQQNYDGNAVYDQQQMLYDQNGQPINFDENGTPMIYNENGELVAYDQQVYYDQNGQMMQYDENGQLINMNEVAYDENGQTALYDENRQYEMNQTGGNNTEIEQLPQSDESGQIINDQNVESMKYGENGEVAQYDQNKEQDSVPIQLDENGQPILYNEHGQVVQYNQNGQPIEYDAQNYHGDNEYDQNQENFQYDPNVQYDENGQPIMQYDENGQPIQYDVNGQPIQYDENGQPILYDENGQPLQYDVNAFQYDENGQVVQYDESGQVAQYDESGQLPLATNNVQGDENVENVNTAKDDTLSDNIFDTTEASDVAPDNAVDELKVENAKKAVLNLLETDSESTPIVDKEQSEASDFDSSK